MIINLILWLSFYIKFKKTFSPKNILENIEYNKKYPDYASFRYICFNEGFLDLNHLSLSDIGNLQKLAQI